VGDVTSQLTCLAARVLVDRFVDLTTCPQCGNAAEITSRDVLESTDGPIEHAKVVCVSQHWFVLPIASLAAPLAHPTRSQTPAI